MKSEKTTVIFFEELKKEAQKRIIAVELEGTLELDEVKVNSVDVVADCYGYDPDPTKQELLEDVHVKTSAGNWLLVWDCKCEFQTVTKE